MYRKEPPNPREPEKFNLPFEGQLSPNNRWVQMSELIPWSEFEDEYAAKFSENNGAPAKPRTYRKRARKDYLAVAKKRKPSSQQKIKAIKKQLQYLKRNLSYIEKLLKQGASLEWLKKSTRKKLETVQEMYQQQLWMYENQKHSIAQRIVSLSQPHVRPIVRGKAGTPVEFGAKISASYVDGFIFLDRISWENFNESGDLKWQIERFKENTGHYPESVHVDQIYRTRENRAFCKERGIRISGPPLGRPPANVSRETQKQALEDERFRSVIEGKFGQGKRRFSLDLVKMKRSDTAETAIAISFLVMNLNTLLARILRGFFGLFSEKNTFLTWEIKKRYEWKRLAQEKVMIASGCSTTKYLAPIF
jgi:hypothetical protein